MICGSCGFELYVPVTELSCATVGLYADSRYPGRLILSLNEHFDHLDDVPSDVLYKFMEDVRRCSRTLRSVSDVERVNVAILGNRESHVHAHIIPRRGVEPNFRQSPWDTTEKNTGMSALEIQKWVTALESALTR